MLTCSRKSAIYELASRVRKALAIATTQTQIDLTHIIKDLGGQIVYQHTEFDAYVIKDTHQTFKIVVNEQNAMTRNVFSIAHELGHLFLHMKYLLDDEVWEDIEIGKTFTRHKGQLYSEIEEEANEFAGAFLMPEHLFRKVIKTYSQKGYYDLEAIAHEFGVSCRAVEVRGRVLGIWRSRQIS